MRGNSPVSGEFPVQRASNAEKVSICWRHPAYSLRCSMIFIFTHGLMSIDLPTCFFSPLFYWCCIAFDKSVWFVLLYQPQLLYRCWGYDKKVSWIIWITTISKAHTENKEYLSFSIDMFTHWDGSVVSFTSTILKSSDIFMINVQGLNVGSIISSTRDNAGESYIVIVV